MIKYKQISETFLLAMIITFSGGLQDAYTYFARNHVFANAQTGNIVLLGSKISDGQWNDALHYLFPLLAFAVGIFIAEQVQGYLKEAKILHWRQYIILIEMIALFISGFFDESLNALANSLVSFACALQVQTFRSMHGYPYASTMCIGNLRSGVASLSHWLRTKKKDSFTKAMHYFAIIFIFALGATLGYSLIPKFGMKTIWFSSFILFFAFLIMLIPEKNDTD